MPTDVIMPQMGESIFEGTITRWLKQPGDAVQKDEPLFEISTDKVDAEIPSPIAGVLREIKVPEGATVQVNTVVAVLDSAPSGKVQVPSASSLSSATKAPTAPTQMAAKPQSAPPQVAQAIVMPQMGESIFEGTITKWLKKAGDPVDKDEPLFEISTDKVDAEIPSPVAGILTEIKVPEGATVQVNTVVAVIGGAPSGKASPVSSSSASGSRSTATQKAPQAQPASTQMAAKPQSNAPEVPQANAREALRSSPLVRRIAKEHNVDLHQVPGTGSNRRITKEDILGYLARPSTAKPQSPAPEVPPQAQSAPPQVGPELKGEVVPMTRMRAIIAERMLESKRISPHVYSVYKVDMTRIARLRDRERAGFEQRNGVRLTYMPFIAAAAVEALRKFPILNASLAGNDIHYHSNINLGIAVALEWGLIVPVIKQAEVADFASLASAIDDLATRARSKKLVPEEVQGSTFTLTNSGAFGGEFGTPIINQPESAILAIGGLRKEPVVLTDAEGSDTIAIRSMQTFCLGFDHRLIDGADAGKFMLEFKRLLETWDRPIG
jgi:2-oxoglutarate dehydrogenase E2 component (dihydrolipoamide succinyltransferase)